MAGPGRNDLCSACHSTNIGPVIGIAKDYPDSRAAAAGTTCVDCHMAPLAEQPEGAERAVLSHALQTPRDPAFLRLAFDVRARREDRRTVVVLGNRAGHRVPGLSGRSLRFDARVLDAAGKVVGEGTLELDTRSYLPVDDTTRLVVEAVGASLRLTGHHTDPRVDDPVPFLDETFPLD
jgi:hypothetical protein